MPTIETAPAARWYHSIQRGWRLLPERYRTGLMSAAPVKRVSAWVRGRYGTHDDVYDAPYFAAVDRLASSSAPAIAGAIVQELAPERLLDVGCGTGALLAALKDMGVRVQGVEYAQAALELCRKRGLNVLRLDLEQPVGFDALDDCDVSVSMEVAEHLPARFADRLVDLLCRARSAVVFTAAVPGQGGSDHVNEQPREYWIEKFTARGFDYDAARTARWREQWRERDVCRWYHENLMVFTRGSRR
jgi:SAM-dependent methyltransferase